MGSKCEHGRRKDRCRDCGTGICIHNKLARYCTDCGAKTVCEHGRRRDRCRECGGSQICEHNKRRSTCVDCGGGEVCEHNKQRNRCVDCRGSRICIHNRDKTYCKICGGSAFCEHKVEKRNCPDCGGYRACKSNKEPHNTGCRTRGNRKLNGYCSHCFINIFPEDPRALMVRKKSKEIQVMTHIFSKHDGFKNDKPFYVDLEGGCCATKRRVDLRKLINNTMFCIEIDENQHKYYIKNYEDNRYNDLFMDFSGKYIFLRYNPDKYIDKFGKSKNPMFETRMEVLEKSISKHINRILNEENKELIEIHHLFYDED